ncbi:YfhO family protein [Candidatus Curtissbacteria bacterium]|nr:YfhO family protein [Candidatus Curtissbacteria bacterium]
MEKFLFNPIIATVLIIFSFFLPNLISGKIPIPADSVLGLYHPWRDLSHEGYDPGKFPVKNPLITDPVLQAYPWRKLTVDNLKSWQVPLWNPYSFSGQPLLANVQSAPFTIGNILFLIFNFKIAWALQVILPPMIAALFMYLFLRSLNLSAQAASFGALILPFSGFFVAWLTWGTIIWAVMWLPAILFAINKLTSKKSPLHFLLIILATAQVIFSGHWQSASYVFLASFIYLVTIFLKTRNFRLIVLPIMAIVLGILITSVQILPSLEFINLSNRNNDQLYYPGRRDWFIPPQNLLQIIAPDFFGNPATYNYWGVWNYIEFVGTIGIIPLTLAIFSVAKKTPGISFFLILIVTALSLGLENPVSKIPYLLKFPLISSMQPSRIIFLLVFALAGLAAFGLDEFLKEKNRSKAHFVPLLIVVGLLAAAAVTFYPDIFPAARDLDPVYIARRNLILPFVTAIAAAVIFGVKFLKPLLLLPIFLIVVLVTAFELFRFGLKFTPFTKISSIFPPTETTQFLEKQKKPFRIMTTDRRILHPNTSTIYNLESVDGYDPLYLQNYSKLVSSWQSGKPQVGPNSFNRIVTPQKFDAKITDALNVKYILTFDQIKDPRFIKVFEEGLTKVYENKSVLPRFYFVEKIVKRENDKEELNYLLLPDTDIKRTAVSRQFEWLSRSPVDGKVELTGYSHQSITLATSNTTEAPLVISNINYPGWQAYIDGQKQEIREVNFLLQSVLVPQGEHELQLKFESRSFYNGLYLSAFALLLSLAGAILIWAKKYQ